MTYPHWGLLRYDPRTHHETRMVRLTLRVLGLSDHEQRIRQLHRTRIDRVRTLNFNAFDLAFPTYPIAIRTGVPAELGPNYDFWNPPAATPENIACMLTSFDSSGLGRRFRQIMKWMSADRPGRPVGMLFPFASVRGGWVIHNAPIATPRSRQRLTIELPDETLRFERYTDLLAGIRASHWNPHVDAPARAGEENGRPPLPLDLGWPVFPAVRRRFGMGVAARVLSLIYQLQTRELPDAWTPAVQRCDGVRYVTLLQKVVARTLSCSVRAVQKAMAELRDAGLLITARGGFHGPGNQLGCRVAEPLSRQIAEREERDRQHL